jgi:hypothetical protein
MDIQSVKKYALFILIGISLVGCADRKQDHRDDTVLNAYRLIDEKRDDEAIELLENALAKDPANYDYKAVLASAYAHKAGIKIQNLVPAVQKSSQLKKLNENAKAMSGETIGAKVDSGALVIASMLGKFSGVLETYAAVPTVDKNQSTYLIHAIYLLNSLGNRIKPEDVIYRAVLEIVLFKYYLAEGFIGEFVEPKTKDEVSCRIDLGNVNDAIIKIGKLLIDIFNDVGFVNPKQAEDMKRLAGDTSDSISRLTIATTTVTVVDEAANIFLKQTAIQNGFGKIIKCGGN